MPTLPEASPDKRIRDRRRPDWTKVALRWVIALLLLGFLCSHASLDKTWLALRDIDLRIFALCMGVYFSVHLLGGFRWFMLAKLLRFPCGFGQAVRWYMTGNFFNLFTPGLVGSDVYRMAKLNSGSGRLLPSFLSIATERYSAFVALCTLVLAGLVFSPRGFFPPVFWWSMAGLCVAAYLAVPLAWALGRRVVHPRRKREHVLHGLRPIWKEPRILLAVWATSLLFQGVLSLVHWGLGEAMGLGVPLTYYLFFTPLVSLVSTIPVSVNGLGLRQVGYWSFLAPVGVPFASILAFGLLWFAFPLVTGIVGAGIYLFPWRRS